MERWFAQLTRVSAWSVLGLLLAILVVLYLQARPAVEAYGLKFLIDPRWGVPVQTASDGEAAVQMAEDEAGIPVEAEDDDDIPTDDEEDVIPTDDEEDEDIIPVDEEDEDGIPTDGDEEETGEDIASSAGQNAAPSVLYGGLVPIAGTLATTVLALLFAVPVALGIAIFLSEIASGWLARPVGIAIELLAAIPSIIYGMWGLFFFGPLVAALFGGNSVSLLVAGLVLGVMIIPFMAALSRDAINTTPDVLKESAYAIGATKFEVVKDVIFPYAKTGILGSAIISLGRALGETMAVAFVIGGVYQLPSHLTDPTISIPVALANNFAESSGLGLSALFYLGLVLFVVSFMVIFFAKRYLLGRGR